nr:MAG TPA: hypothetical protein [Caudoviricetes sp.]
MTLFLSGVILLAVVSTHALRVLTLSKKRCKRRTAK